MPVSDRFSEICAEEFEDFVRQRDFVVIHFWAQWNHHDLQMRALLTSLFSVAPHESISFARFDIDKPGHAEICRRLKVINLPFLAFYRNGALIGRCIGLVQSDKLSEYLHELLRCRSFDQ